MLFLFLFVFDLNWSHACGEWSFFFFFFCNDILYCIILVLIRSTNNKLHTRKHLWKAPVNQQWNDLIMIELYRSMIVEKLLCVHDVFFCRCGERNKITIIETKISIFLCEFSLFEFFLIIRRIKLSSYFFFHQKYHHVHSLRSRKKCTTKILFERLISRFFCPLISRESQSLQEFFEFLKALQFESIYFHEGEIRISIKKKILYVKILRVYVFGNIAIFFQI